MITLMTHSFLQGYWWMIISLLGGLLLFLMFVQGGQSFIFTLPRNKSQRSLLVNAMGRKWEFTFTTLVTFGGAFFASFPLFYATSFGGAYWLWMAILFSFILQAVAYEYRSKPSNVFGTNVYDVFLFVNGCIGPFLIGVTVGTFFTGSDFSLDVFNRVTWGNRLHGIEAIANTTNLLAGVSVLFLARVLGLLYLINTVDDEVLAKESRNALIFNSVPFVLAFVAFTAMVLTHDGYQVDMSSGIVKSVGYFYFKQLTGSILISVLFFGGVALVLTGIAKGIFRRSVSAIWYSGAGSVAVGIALFFLAGYNGSAFYPSHTDLQSSLTLSRASSSFFTLKTMMYVSFVIPFVVAYIWYAWRAVSSRRITGEEISGGEHIY